MKTVVRGVATFGLATHSHSCRPTTIRHGTIRTNGSNRPGTGGASLTLRGTSHFVGRVERRCCGPENRKRQELELFHLLFQPLCHTQLTTTPTRHGCTRLHFAGSTLAHRQNANLWLEAVVPRDGVARPRLRSVYCCGCPFKTSTHIIFYRRPDASRFHRYVVGTAASASAFTCRTVQRKQMQLSQGEDLGAVVQKAAVRGGRQPTDMHYVMNEINSAQQFLRLVKDSVDNRKRRLNRPLRQASMASLPRHLFLTVALALRTVLGATLALLGARLPKGFPGIGGSSLRSTSVFFQQLDLRIRDICSWPLLYRELLRLRRLRRPMVRAGEIEMRLMSSVACVALDLALGIALTAYLAIHAGAGGYCGRVVYLQMRS